MTTTYKIIQHKVGWLNLAEELGNVSPAIQSEFRPCFRTV